ncbi:MAG: hypothetical protein AAGC96_16355, partial [Pseudomonadota bacterium]
TSDTFTGQAILKLDQDADPRSLEQNEAKLHEQAIRDAPEFAAKHLPRLLHSLHHGDQVAILSNIAARGLEYAEPWIECSHDLQLEIVRKISSGLLEEWNTDYQLNKGVLMPGAILENWLEHRIDPARGGRIHSFLADECGIAFETPTILIDGHWYPNPLAFVLGVRELPERLQIRGVMGHSHCDFHGLNLLVGQMDGPDRDYYLIDLAMYQSRQFLFYDHAYFELAQLLFSRGGAAPEDWSGLLEQLGRFKHHESERGLRSDDIGLIDLVRTMRRGITDWIEHHEADRLSFMENQSLLARVAVGLNFSHKKISLEERQMAFFYAATNLKDYLKLNRVKWPKSGPEFTIGGIAVAPKQYNIPSEERQPSEVPATSGALVQTQQTDAATKPPAFGLRGLLFELRRRNVVRVAGLYAVVAWICIQVVTALQTPLQLPEWSVALVAVLLAVGFPIACIIAWAFELSASGLQRTSPSDGNDQTGGFRALVDYAVLAGMIVIIAITGRDLLPWTTNDYVPAIVSQSAPVPDKPEGTSLAVLPFTNLNADGDDSFADGLTIEIFNVLAQTRAFRLPGITSTFQYKSNPDDLRSIGKALGVDYLVEGTVRRNEDNFRIEANLIRVDDGFLVWSNSYRVTMENVFVTQETIAREIGTALSTPLDIDADVLEAQRTNDPRAYELFIRGIALLEQRGAALIDAMRSLEIATSRQPDFAAAWGALSLVYNVVPTYVPLINDQPVRPDVYYRKAKEAALKASEIDPDLPMVRHALGNSYQRERQWAAAEKEYKAALMNDPGDHRVMLDYAGLLRSVGKHGLSLEYVERAQQLDPLNAQYKMWATFLGWRDDNQGDAVEIIENIFKDTRQFRQIALRLIISHWVREGEMDKAYDIIESCASCSESLRTRATSMLDASKVEQPEAFFEEYKDDNILGYQLLYTVGGEDLLLQGFEYIGLEAQRRLQFFTVPWRMIDVIGDNDSFKKTVRDMGLYDYWQEYGWPDYCKPVSETDFRCSTPQSTQADAG